MRLPEDFAVGFRALPICRRADFDSVFWGGFGGFEFFLRFDRGKGTFARRFLR
jgi:hypothetical protein